MSLRLRQVSRLPQLDSQSTLPRMIYTYVSDIPSPRCYYYFSSSCTWFEARGFVLSIPVTSTTHHTEVVHRHNSRSRVPAQCCNAKMYSSHSYPSILRRLGTCGEEVTPRPR